MPGEANYWTKPSQNKLQSAMQSLARFHLATSELTKGTETCPAIAERRQAIQELLNGGFVKLIETAKRMADPVWQDLISRMETQFAKRADEVLEKLNQAQSLSVKLVPAIRDIWHDHVLFGCRQHSTTNRTDDGGTDNEQVTGFIDFGAMRFDSRSVDVARLAGSLTEGQFCESRPAAGSTSRELLQSCSPAIEYYNSFYQLEEHETRLLDVLRTSTDLLSPLNWLKWIYSEQREFAEPDQIVVRVDRFLRRLESEG